MQRKRYDSGQASPEAAGAGVPRGRRAAICRRVSAMERVWSGILCVTCPPTAEVRIVIQ